LEAQKGKNKQNAWGRALRRLDVRADGKGVRGAVSSAYNKLKAVLGLNDREVVRGEEVEIRSFNRGKETTWPETSAEGVARENGNPSHARKTHRESQKRRVWTGTERENHFRMQKKSNRLNEEENRNDRHVWPEEWVPAAGGREN